MKSLYIHIPFCNSICDYCDFPKLQYFRNFAEKYLDVLKEEIKSYQIKTPLKTIYIGGGTPTALDDDLFEILLQMVKPYVLNIEEYTIETNPESLTLTKLELMKKYGVNRISIGVESTNDEILKSINRKHTWLDVQTCVLNARKVGFDNINVDLILGLPNVTKSLLSKDIENILSLNVEHISCYSLTVNENTVFYINNISEGTDESQRELYDLVEEALTSKGYIHYEVSSWAKLGHESKHNLTYWKNEQYYGLGLGASGFIGNIRYSNTKSINKYLENNIVQEREVLSKEDFYTCFIMLNLRTIKGIDLTRFKQEFGYDFYEENKEKIDNFVKEGLLKFEKNVNSIVPTYEGMMVLDKIILEFI